MRPANRHITAAAMLLVVSVCWPACAAAWQILTALTDPCHEQLSLSALPGVGGVVFAGDVSGVVPSALFPPAGTPVDPIVAGVADMIAGKMDVDFDSYPTALAALSLFVGSRYPDVLEGSAYDFFLMRPLMLSDVHEDSHCLRRSWDDGPAGDDAAVAAARALILEEIGMALDSARGPVGKRFVSHTVSLDYYGEVDVMLYEPLVMLGRALHTFEDSFAHTLRSDDLAGILSVLNSIDAVSSHFDERRDGIAHSLAMDRCMDDAAEAAVICAVAVRELVAAVSAAVDPSMEPGISLVLDDWMTVTPGCTFENNYCDAVWLQTARRDPYEPFIPMVLGCGAGSVGNTWALVLLLLPFSVLIKGRKR